MKNPTSPRRLETGASSRQRGATLVVSLLLLIAITVLSTTAVSMSVMELRMSGNVEANANTFQTGAAAVDFVLSDISNLPWSDR
jgi:type IV pilus assembly protein PilX